MSIKNYKLFIESYEEIMKNISDEVDFNKIDGLEKELTSIRDKINIKKEELEKQLENLENLQTQAFTEDNKKIVADKKKEINETIIKIKETIQSYENDIKTMKDNIEKLKQTK